MNFNWAYFPLEINGNSTGIQNSLPNFSTLNGTPWSLNNGWFNGDGNSTSLITPWNDAPNLFSGVALPKDGSHLIGFQIQLDNIPATNQTVFFCGYNKAGNIDGIKCLYTKSGELIFIIQNRNYSTILKAANNAANVSNRLMNIFCHIDHRPVGVGTNLIFIHTYDDGTDVKYTTFEGKDLSTMGDIYPQVIDQATALILGADQKNGTALSGTHFTGRIRRFHLIKFGALANDQPDNLAELMNELSKANMVPTPKITQLMGYPVSVASRSFVKFG